MEVVNLLAANTPLQPRNFDYPRPANATITATAASGRISCSFTLKTPIIYFANHVAAFGR
jgi:hypothetical protein